MPNFTSLFYSENADFIATGGRGDKAIFVYKASNEGKFNRLFKLQGHTGLYNLLNFNLFAQIYVIETIIKIILGYKIIMKIR